MAAPAKDTSDIPNPFSNPQVKQKLKQNEKTKAFMEKANFVKIIDELAKDTQSLTKYVGDHRVMTALAVLLDVDITVPKLPTDPYVYPPGQGPTSSELTGEHSDDGESSSKKKQEKKKTAASSGAKAGTALQQQALEEKEKGNTAYKKKDFTTALAHYDKAIELDPANVTFITNKAAVYFEQGEWGKCIEACELAVEKGRELRADFKIIAKAYARIGNVYVKQDKLNEAVKAYDHSLAEHRNPDVVKKREEVQKKLKEQERLAYINPEKSLEEKAQGNELFKKGDFPGAVKCYTEAIKRNPEDAKLFSNRAACYQKLLEFNLALKDCEECIRLDPTFIKGHIRKGHALLGLKDTVKAMQAFQSALDIDPNNTEARSGMQRSARQDDPEARRKAAMHDPEVQKILHDPAMQLILQQMQSNPEALRDHLQNPDIAAKIQKLMESGFISVR